MATEETVQDPYVIAKHLGLKDIRNNAYSDVSFELPKGKVSALCGENNSGKTELLLTIAGRMVPTKGELEVAGFESPRERKKIAKISGLGFFAHVNEVQRVLSVKTVTAAELNLFSKKSNKKATLAYLERFGLAELADKTVQELDRRQFYKLGIVLGMAGDPELLVVDDIESELTRHQSMSIIKYLQGLSREYGTTIVVGVNEYELAHSSDCAVPISNNARAQRAIVEQKIKDGTISLDEEKLVD